MCSVFQTLRKPLEVRGIGLHSGQKVRARLLPRQGLGLVFRRMDLANEPSVEADWRNITSTMHATTLQDGDAKVSTPEHLLAALWILGVTHCEIQLDGAEVPILDGSAAPWCEVLKDEIAPVETSSEALNETSSTRTRLAPNARPTFILSEPVFFQNGNSSVLALPHHELRVSVAVDFGRDYLATQNFDSVVTRDSFVRDIAAARTFALEEWLQALQSQGLVRGGSLENALLLRDDAPSTPLRFATELARHKALDLLGDLSLMFASQGATMRAHFIAVRAGHASHHGWMQVCDTQNALMFSPAIFDAN